jgi:hypothetical protein
MDRAKSLVRGRNDLLIWSRLNQVCLGDYRLQEGDMRHLAHYNFRILDTSCIDFSG